MKERDDNLWESVAGHSELKGLLKKDIESRTLKGAYLFHGPAGTGKFRTALVFAAAALCPFGSCGECPTCRRVLKGTHPDVSVIASLGKNIPVEVLREARLSAFRKPVEGAWRFFIIRDAEKMWDEAASTLLKVLEEPPDGAIFILVSSSLELLLPTIVSRCVKMKFNPLPRGEIADFLTRNEGVDPERAALIERISEGLPGRAVRLSREPWHLDRRNNIIRVVRSIRGADLNRVLEMAEALHAAILAPVEEVAVIYRRRRDELEDGSLDPQTAMRFGKELDEEFSRERLKEEISGLKEVLSVMSSWLRDVLVMKESGNADLLVNVDLAGELKKDSEALELGSIVGCLRLVEEANDAVERNVPSLLVLEGVLTGMKGVLSA